jgi:hypothetical protein
MRRFWTVVFLGVLWLSLSVLDTTLARRAQAVIDAAQAQSRMSGAGAEWAWRVRGLEADMCNALTGGLWLSWVMRKSSALDWPAGLKVKSENDGCQRFGANTLIFYR